VKLGLEPGYLEAVGAALRRPSAARTFLVEQRALVSQLPALEARLPEIAAQTTIVIGSADRIVPPSSAKLLAGQIRGARLLPLKGAGHLLSMHHAEQIAELALAA
jgi:pimeloyl-ACP methyl ester carboxylesterase